MQACRQLAWVQVQEYLQQRHSPEAMLGDRVPYKPKAGQDAKLPKHRRDFVLAPLQWQAPAGTTWVAGGPSARQTGWRRGEGSQGSRHGGSCGGRSGKQAATRTGSAQAGTLPHKHVGMPSRGAQARAQRVQVPASR